MGQGKYTVDNTAVPRKITAKEAKQINQLNKRMSQRIKNIVKVGKNWYDITNCSLTKVNKLWEAERVRKDVANNQLNMLS